MRPQLGKEKILDAAVKLFSEKGYHGASVSEIAAAAAVSKGLMYNYFNSKEALLLAIIERASAKMFAVAGNMAKGTDEQDFNARLSRFLESYGRLLKRNRRYLSFQLSLMFQPDLKKIVEVPLSARAERLLADTEAMFKGTDNDDIHFMARRFIAELDGITLHYLAVFKNYPLEDMLKHLFDSYKDQTP